MAAVKLPKDVTMVTDNADRYQSRGDVTILPFGARRGEDYGTAKVVNSKETFVAVEGLKDLSVDMDKVTPEMAKMVYDASVEKFPEWDRDDAQYTARQEYVWQLLDKLIREGMPKAKAAKKETAMLPRSKKRMTPPERSETKPKKKLILKLKKKTKTVETKPIATKPVDKIRPRAEIDMAKILQIPGLGPEPTKPSLNVTFDFGSMGRQRARYHWAGMGNDNRTLNLIFDTRFEHMDAFIPASIASPDHVVVINISTTESGEVYDYRCWGVVTAMCFGVFTFVQFVLIHDELGPELHEESPDGETRGDSGGPDTTGDGWADGGVEEAHEEILRRTT